MPIVFGCESWISVQNKWSYFNWSNITFSLCRFLFFVSFCVSLCLSVSLFFLSLLFYLSKCRFFLMCRSLAGWFVFIITTGLYCRTWCVCVYISHPPNKPLPNSTFHQFENFHFKYQRIFKTYQPHHFFSFHKEHSVYFALDKIIFLWRLQNENN